MGGGVQWVKLIDLGELIRGNGLQKKDFTETGVPAIHYGQIYTYYGTFATKTKSFVSPELAKKLKKAKYGDVLIAGTSENLKDVMKPLGWLGSEIAFSGDMFAFRPNKRVNTKYLTYILQTERFYKFKEKYAQGTKVIRVKADNFLNYEIPLPTFEEQQRIVSILDKFETLTNSITEGLPLAIEQSQKRYEYYRELLLNFNNT
ncbi:restriction endonuclease subunit S [Haemophilus seminalis]|uniref:Restriction endonuclease subunit S n=1 Tax=Haemophilus seminalis TaxID=2582921 RepID=A0ABQ6SLV2_9PAST|nr:restriction endonuclease subunit S [Haemophilus seminalis]